MFLAVCIILYMLNIHIVYCVTTTPNNNIYAVRTERDLPQSKFTRKMNKMDILFHDAHSASECNVHLDLVWTNFIDSGVYSTPLISEWKHGRGKMILVPGFNGQFTMLDHDGHHIPGLPLTVTNNNEFYSSPLLVNMNDNDNDNADIIVWVGGEGKIFLLKEAETTNIGLKLASNPIIIPKLKIRKGWYENTSEMPCTDDTDDNNIDNIDNNIDNNNKHKHEHKKDDDKIEKRDSYLALNENKLTDEGRKSLELLLQNDDISDIFLANDDEDYHPNNPKNNPTKNNDWVYVDAHLLSSPSLADVNNDGNLDLIMSVSYYFDDDKYSNKQYRSNRLGPDDDIDTHQYVAGGIVVIDIKEKKIIWKEHLDLTTDHTPRKAYIYGTPTIVDIDNDGELEIIVGTSLGFIYAFKANNGELLDNFPLIMDEIQAQIAVEDVNNDGVLELIAMDKRGNVLCFDYTGKELWTQSIKGLASAHATFGDVNGDDIIDIVIATVSGSVWVLQGTDGSIINGFPIQTKGKILAPVTLVNLDTTHIMHPGLHLLFSSFDGYVYVVDGRTGCINKYDIGERTYSMILVDDILGRNKMDILVSTMNGNIFCFASESTHNSLKTWSSQNHHRNGFSSREDHLGIMISKWNKQHKTIIGKTFQFTFEIIDKRNQPDNKYDVALKIGNIILFSERYTKPGVYTVTINSLSTPSIQTAILEMILVENQFYFSDTIIFEFNLHYYMLLKWYVIIPAITMAVLVATTYNTYRTDTDVFLDLTNQ